MKSTRGMLLLGLLVILATGLALPAAAGETVVLSNEQSGLTVLNQSLTSVTVKVNVGSVEFIPVVTKEGEFVLPRVDRFARSQDFGNPDLPVLSKLLAIPVNSQVIATVIDRQTEEIHLQDIGITNHIMPAQPSLSKSERPEDVEFLYNVAAYEQPGYYSLDETQTQIMGTLRSLHLGMVTVAPFAYDPVENKLQITREITLQIDFVGGDLEATEDLYKKYYSPFYEPIYDMICNYEGASAYSKTNDSFDLVKYPVKYLIISDRMFESQLEPFIEWKTKKGFNVITAYTDVIGTSRTAIKNYIQGLYDAGTTEDPAPSFVLLVGDVAQIESWSGTAGSHISDLYYCEFTGDNLPEIYYGRFSASEPSHLQPQIDKTLEYEQYLMPDPSYLEEVTLVSGVDGTYAITHGNGQINYGTTYYFNAAHGITPNVWLYPASDASGAAAAIIATINDGVGLYNYTAHCSPAGHADPSFTTSDIPGLTNYHKYLLGIGNCCESNTFNASSPCFGEAFLRVADKGGIGYIGGTNSTYWYEDYYWGVGYGPVVGSGPTYEQTTHGAYDGLFHDHGEPVERHYVTNAAIIFAGNLAVCEGGSRVTYYWEIYHLMGDPSVMSYMGVPTENNISHASTLLLSASTFTVEADPGSYVALSRDGVLYGAAYVDASGSVDVTLEPFGIPGEADIVITAQNRQPYISTVTVIAPDGPFLVYDGSVVNDIAGNNNGLVDYSETILLGVTLKNVGPDVCNNITATLTTTDEYVTIYDNTELYESIDGDFGTKYIADAFSFKVASTVPDKHKLIFSLELYGTDKWDTTWVTNFNLTAHAPNIEFVSVQVADIGGNGNGILDPGESGELVVTIRNIGSGQATEVAVSLSETDPYGTVNDDYGYIGSVDSAGGTGNNAADVFNVSAGSTCPMGYEMTFDLTITGAGNYFKETQFMIIVGDREALFTEDFSSDQGWTGYGGTAEWTRGPAGGGPGTDSYGGPDPAVDHSPTEDNMVLGNDLTPTDGDYSASISGTQWITSPIIDCSDYSSVQLTYWRWLGVESSNYDHAYFQVYNGTTWVTLYENSATTNEQTWSEHFHDLTAYADDNSEFRIRFGLGGTDGSMQYCGWNIDDIVIKGYNQATGTPALSMGSSSFDESMDIDASIQRTIHIDNNGDGRLKIKFLSAEYPWLTHYTGYNYIQAGGSADFTFTINTTGMSAGDYDGALNYETNDPAHLNGSIPVDLHIYAPQSAFSHEMVADSLDPDQTSATSLHIDNTGQGTLKIQFSTDINWLNISTALNTIGPGGNLDFGMTFNSAGLNPGVYYGNLSYTTNDPADPSGSIPLMLNIYAPVMAVDMLALNEDVAIGEFETFPINIDNSGPGRLNFTVGCVMYSKGRVVPVTVATENVREPIGHVLMDADKDGGTMEPIYAPQDKSSGGPDAFGHNWVDSDDPQATPYSWVDISAVGIDVQASADPLTDDDFAGPFDIGFAFPYYDNVYTQLYIGSNGLISFGAGVTSRNNDYIDAAIAPFNLIAMWWDDLDPRKGGNVYYHYDAPGGRFIVTFSDIRRYAFPDGTGSLNFQVILDPSGKITLQYATMDPGTSNLLGASVGLKNQDGSDYLVIVRNAAYMHNDLAIHITAGGWLDVQPRGGSIAPFANTSLEVKLDASELGYGTYNGQIEISSNDPLYPVHTIPVVMTVGDPWFCGDVDNSGSPVPNLIDILYLIDYLYGEPAGPAPPFPDAADVDASGKIDLIDILTIIGFVYNETGELICP